jgi:hypothetical protein
MKERLIGMALALLLCLAPSIAAQAQQGGAQRRAVPIALDLRMFGQQLAEQSGAGAGQTGNADEAGIHGQFRWDSRVAAV